MLPDAWSLALAVARVLMRGAPETIVRALVIWGTVGALVGATLGGAVFVLANRRGVWPAGRWARRIALAWLLGTGAVVTGGTLALEGVTRALPVALEESALGRVVLTPLAEATARVIALVAAGESARQELKGVDRLKDLLAFDFGRLAELAKAGVWDGELHVGNLKRATDGLTLAAALKIAARIEAAVVAEVPTLRNRDGTTILGYTIPALVHGFIRSEAEDGATTLGVATLWDDLEAEARREGDPETIAREPLREILVDKAIVPALLTPVRQTTRFFEQIAFVVLLLGLALPPTTFACARRRPAAVIRNDGGA